jgi:hypothetical protein
MKLAEIKLSSKNNPAVSAALDEIYEKFPSNPLNNRERVFSIQNIPVAKFEVSSFGDKLRINSIESFKTGQGVGSLLLSRILRIADKHKVEVSLTASSFGDNHVDGNKLKAWYSKFGFHNEMGYDEALGYMIRDPK